jgi:hypothetical protein
MAETSCRMSSGARNRRYSISLGPEKDQRGMHFPALAVVPTRSQSGIAYLELKAVKAFILRLNFVIRGTPACCYFSLLPISRKCPCPPLAVAGHHHDSPALP